MEHERICIVDRKHYSFCPNCGGNKDELWRYIFCSDECYQISSICDDIKSNKISQTEANDKLSKYDLSGIENFRADIKDTIKSVLVKDEPVIEEVQIIEQPKKNKKRNNIVNE